MSEELNKEEKAAKKAKEKDLKYRNEVYFGAKRIFQKGLVDFGEGNVSMRVKKADEMYITPTQNDYENMTVDDIVHMTFNGEHLSKGRRASSEYKLHAAVYKARKKAKCVIHCHPVYASMLAVTGTDLPTIIEEMAFFIGGDVKVSEFGASGTDEAGDVVVKGMGDTNAVLLRNHGLVVCGKDMKSTVKTAILVEKMARIYVGALSIGKVEKLSEDKIKKWVDMFDGLNRTAPKK